MKLTFVPLNPLHCIISHSKAMLSRPVSATERVPPTIKSTWVTGSVGVKESLLSREPVKVTIGDNVRVFTKTKVRGQSVHQCSNFFLAHV